MIDNNIREMKKSYFKNYLKIYLWKGLSSLLGFLSLFIVIPIISSQQEIYGIYMVCISTTIFLSYADIGFIGAGKKYCAECFARNDSNSEIRIEGFACFILAFFISFIVIFFLFASYSPGILIKDIGESKEVKIASALLLIQGIFSYEIVLQKLNDLIYGIRLEDYRFQKIKIVASLIKIFSVFYFFKDGNYNIVKYFLFLKIVGLLASSGGLLLARFKYNYDFRLFFRSFKFSKEIFDRTKNLAIGTFYVAIMFILYFELDSIAVSKLLGAKALAIFVMGLITIKLFRSLFAVIYSPFRARFNHLVGLNDINGLKHLYYKAVKRTMPLVLMPTISVIILMKPFILSLVGVEYVQSVGIATLVTLNMLFVFVSRPSRILIVALEKIRQLYVINSVMAAVYWAGIIATIRFWDIYSFAIFKFISLLLANLFYLVVGMKFLEIDILQFIKKVILPIAGPVVFLIVSLIMIEPYLPVEKGKANLLLVVFTGGVFSLLSFILYYLMSKDFKGFINENIVKIRGKRNTCPKAFSNETRVKI